MYISILSLFLKHNDCCYTWGLLQYFDHHGANTLKHCQKIHNIWLDKHLTNERSTPRKLTTPV